MGFSLISKDRVVYLLVRDIFGLQLVLLLEALVFGSKVDSPAPVLAAEVEVREEGVGAGLEVHILAV